MYETFFTNARKLIRAKNIHSSARNLIHVKISTNKVGHPRKFFPAKCKNFAFGLIRESFFQ